MMNFKKITALLLLLAFLFCFSGCNNKETKYNDKNTSSAVTIKPADTSKMNFGFSKDDTDSSYDEKTAVKISYADSSVIVDGEGAVAEGKSVTIKKSGSYLLTGSCKNGSLTINAKKTDKIQLILNGLELNNNKGAAIYVKNGKKVVLTVAKNTENILSDGSSYDSTDGNTTIDAAVFSKSDLTLNGQGSLTVKGNYKHGIVSKDDLVITGSTISVTSKNVGLSGKDCIKLGEAKIKLNAGSDALRSDNTEDSSKGYVYIDGVDLDITALNDGIQAETVLNIANGNIKIVSGGGSKNSSTNEDGNPNEKWGFGFQENKKSNNNEVSAKGLKSGSDILITNVNCDIDSADDSIHSNGSINISGGKFDLSSGDDGIHADSALTVSNGNINITKSYEGIESSEILIFGGNINLKASDDGLNAAGGNDSSSVVERPGRGEFTSSNGKITLSGGYLFINASGDGIDSNGNLTVTSGKTIVSGPTNNGNGPLDYAGKATVTGGVLIALGSSGMAQGFSSAENQGAILYNFSSQIAGTSFALCDSSGKAIIAFTPPKAYSSVAVTAPQIDDSSTYTIVVGGNITNLDSNGYAEKTSVSGGTSLATIEMTSYIYSSGGISGGPGGPMDHGFRNNGGYR